MAAEQIRVNAEFTELKREYAELKAAYDAAPKDSKPPEPVKPVKRMDKSKVLDEFCAVCGYPRKSFK